MRRNLHAQALVDLEHEASQSMAVVAQTVRWPDNWKLTIPEIKPSHVYELLRPIRVEKRETATTFRTMHHLAGPWERSETAGRLPKEGKSVARAVSETGTSYRETFCGLDLSIVAHLILPLLCDPLVLPISMIQGIRKLK